MSLQELAKEAFRCTPIATGLHEDVDDVTVLIHGTPQILPFTVDGDEDLAQKPRIAESTMSALQTPCKFGTELRAPPTDCLVRHDGSSFGEYILDIPEAETEFEVEPDCMTDNFAWISVPAIEGSSGFHDASLAVMGSS